MCRVAGTEICPVCGWTRNTRELKICPFEVEDVYLHRSRCLAFLKFVNYNVKPEVDIEDVFEKLGFKTHE